jgi:succinoglycan biosynthesis protein ExoO
MANFNGARFIADAVRSVQAQSLTCWELIVVDDASSDASVPICLELAQNDSRIIVLIQEANGGPAAARNRALDIARGDWIAILDSDDVMAPRRLERLVARADGDAAEIVADNQMLCSHDLTPEQPFMRGLAARQAPVGLVPFIQSGCLYSGRPDLGFLKPLIRTSLIRETGARYDERLRISEDFHFLLRLLRGGAAIAIEPEPLYFYRKHAASISHRQSPQTLAAMIAADQALRADGSLPAPARRALDSRIRGLRTWLVHERVITAFKAGDVLGALVAALPRPHAWPLLSRPIRARLARWLHGPHWPGKTAMTIEGQL